MAGIGKSVIAVALGHDEEIQRAFPDGVLWIPVGQAPAIVPLQYQLALDLGDLAPSFNSIEEGNAGLRGLMLKKSCLMILDDVWDLEHVNAFSGAGGKCRILVTTRDASLLKHNRLLVQPDIEF